ncbi:gluconokinase [Thalassotalea piscium]
MTKKLNRPRLIIVMGVSGCGKSTIASTLALTGDYCYIDADDFHSAEAKGMMSQNIALTDEIRMPWINVICETLCQYQSKNQSVVLAFSGLKAKYRQPFRMLGFNTRFILLHGSQSLIAKRLAVRENHFANENLLTSQFETLELPTTSENDIATFDVVLPINELVTAIIKII